MKYIIRKGGIKLERKFLKKAIAFTSALVMVSGAAACMPLTRINADELLGETSFDYKMLPWHTVESSPAKQFFEIEDGAVHITIKNAQGMDGEAWDLQFRHKNLNFKAGHTYKVSFRVKSGREGMELLSAIGNIKGDEDYFVLNENKMENGPYNGGQWGRAAKLSSEWKDFSGEFTPVTDIEGAEWRFQYAKGTDYEGNALDGDELWFDEMSIECTSCDECGETGDYFGEVGRGLSGLENNFISVNQLGYLKDSRKTAVLSDNAGDILYHAKRTDLDEQTYNFEVVDAATDKTVFSGKTGSAVNDRDSGDKVFKIDFSEFNREGTYYIRVGEYRSFNFRIGNDIYSEKERSLLTDSVNYFYQNRTSADIEEKYISSGEKSFLARSGSHIKDIAYVQTEWKDEYTSKKEASETYASSTVDVSGGWCDTSDQGKYVVNSGLAVWTLQNMYESALLNGESEIFSDGSGAVLNPENGNGVPDILDEAAYELDWMSEMVVKEDEPTWGKYAGMVYHKVQNNEMPVFPELQLDYIGDYDNKVRIIKPPTFAATLNYAACAAQAARLWKPYDAEKAKEYLDAAKNAFEAYEKNYYEPDLTETMHPDFDCTCTNEEINKKSLYAPEYQRKSAIAYGDTDVRDEAYWAACELYVSSKVMEDADADGYFKRLSAYETPDDSAFSIKAGLADSEKNGESLTSFNWKNTAAAGNLTLELHRDILSESVCEKLDSSLIKAADAYFDVAEEQGYGVPFRHKADLTENAAGYPETINDGYDYNSNSMVLNNAVIMAYAYYRTNDSKYLDGVTAAMDYLLGTNPLSFSYITGYGSYTVRNPRNLNWAHELDPVFPSAPDGVVSSGPNAGLQDQYVRALGFVPGLNDNYSQRCFVDSAESWSTNSASLCGNASLSWVVSFLASPGGQTDSGKTGDVNLDGKIDVTDITVLSIAIAGDTELTELQQKNADVDSDGKVLLTDLARLRQFISHVINKF